MNLSCSSSTVPLNFKVDADAFEKVKIYELKNK